MKGSRCEADAWLSSSERLHVDDHEHAIDVGIEVADVAILVDRLARGLAGVKKGLVVEQLLKRVVGVELGEEERRIAEARSRDGEGVALEELDRARDRRRPAGRPGVTVSRFGAT